MVNTSPIITLILSPFLVKSERIGIWVVFGTAMIITGGFLFYKVGKITIWSVLASFIAGIGSIVAKIGTTSSNGVSFAFLSFISLVLIVTVYEMLLNKRSIPGIIKKNYKKVLPPAFFSAIATALYFTALETGGITKIAPLMRFNLIFGFLLSYFILKEKDNLLMRVLGGVSILIGGIMVLI